MGANSSAMVGANSHMDGIQSHVPDKLIKYYDETDAPKEDIKNDRRDIAHWRRQWVLGRRR